MSKGTSRRSTPTRFWAMEVAHTYSAPPSNSSISLLIAAPDLPLIAASPGDVVFAFSRGQLVNAAKIRKVITMPELLGAIVSVPGTGKGMEHVAAVNAVTLRMTLSLLLHPTQAHVMEAAQAELRTTLEPDSLICGFARPYDWVMGEILLDRLAS